MAFNVPEVVPVVNWYALSGEPTADAATAVEILGWNNQ
jgi:hypothetical protein